jgi:limonene-1,2-epoxide hydrolase
MDTQPRQPQQAVEHFAAALDADDFDALATVIAHDCRYVTRTATHVGAGAIAASHADGSRRARALFDSVEFHHTTSPIGPDRFRIAFADELTYRDEVLHHVSIQEVTVDGCDQLHP